LSVIENGANPNVGIGGFEQCAGRALLFPIDIITFFHPPRLIRQFVISNETQEHGAEGPGINGSRGSSGGSDVFFFLREYSADMDARRYAQCFEHVATR
jgi:hypothetical protein